MTFLIDNAKPMAGLTPCHCHACTGGFPGHVCYVGLLRPRRAETVTEQDVLGVSSLAQQNIMRKKDLGMWMNGPGQLGALFQSLVGQCPLATPSRVMTFLTYEAQDDCFLDFLGEVGIMYESCPTW